MSSVFFSLSYPPIRPPVHSVQHSVRGHCGLHGHLVHVLRAGPGENAERAVRPLRPAGRGKTALIAFRAGADVNRFPFCSRFRSTSDAEIPSIAHQNPGRLLLLHQRGAGGAARPCGAVRPHGTVDGEGHQVSERRARSAGGGACD